MTALRIGAVALALLAGGAGAQAQGGNGSDQGQSQSSTNDQGNQGQENSGQGGTGAQAGQQAQQMPTSPATPTQQDKALQPLFGRGGTWTGQVPAGAMGPNSPAMTSQGQSDCKAILGGTWYTCDIEDRVGPGTPNSMDYLAHMIVGYDRSGQTYTATMVDNQGTPPVVMNGTLTGTRFVLETPKAYPMRGGMTAKSRLTFDFADPNNIAFTAEHQLPNQDWTVAERATIHPRTGKPTGQPAASS